MAYLWTFLFGGLLCVIGQILLDKTKLTPARILVGYVVAGVFLGAAGLYKPFAEFAKVMFISDLCNFLKRKNAF